MKVDSVKLAALTANLEGGVVADPEVLQAVVENYALVINANDDVMNTKANKTQEAWIAPTLLNGWVNYGGTEDPVGYMKDTLGFVHIRGMIKSGVTTPGTLIFNLPPGYRPLNGLTQVTISNDVANDVLSRIHITNDGKVEFWAGASFWFSLNGIIFQAEQ